MNSKNERREEKHIIIKLLETSNKENTLNLAEKGRCGQRSRDENDGRFLFGHGSGDGTGQRLQSLGRKT